MAKYTSGRQKDLKVGIVSYSENLTSLSVIGNANFTGIVTASSFYGNLVGIASSAIYATTSGIATYATNAGIATYATTAGIATYATTAGIATYATNAGVSTYATTAGVSTYATNAGISTYATNAGIATYATTAGVSTYATNAGVSTYATNAGVSTYATNSGIATYATKSGISTNVIGGISSVTQLSVSGVSTFSGITTHTAPVFGTQASFTGIVSATSFYGSGQNLSDIIATKIDGVVIKDEGISLPNNYGTLDFVGNYVTATGIGSTATITFTTPPYATSAGVSTALQNTRTFEITGDIVASPVNFNGTGNVSLAATIQPNSVALGTDTTGDYVQSISGTVGQIGITNGTGESSTPVISFAVNPTIPGNVTIGNDLQVNNNLNVTGNITIGGTSAYVIVNDFRVKDGDIVLGFTTDSNGNDVSNDTTANHGGISVASTVGSPLVNLYIPGIETTPATYKKIMWFKSGSFSGLNTDAWLSNYAIGIGSTQFPNGTRLAAGAVQFTERDLAAVRNINATGIVSATSFYGSGQNLIDIIATKIDGVVIKDEGISLPNNYGILDFVGNYVTATGVGSTATITFTTPPYSTSAGIATYATTSGISTYATSSGIATYSTTSGIATYATSSGISTYSTTAGIATYSTTAGIATYATTAGVSTNIKGGLGGNIPYQSSADTTAFVSNGTSGQVLIFNGSVPTWGNASNAAGAFAGITIRDEGNVVGTASSITTINFVGNNVTATATSGANGISTVTIADYVSVAGIATYATTAGIATYATTAGVSTNIKGGLGGNIPYQSSADTTTFVSNGTSGQVLIFNGSVPTWGNVSAASGSFGGITIRDEGVVVGTASSVTTINFVGNNVTATATSGANGISTVTIADYVSVAGVSTNVIGGIGSVTQLSVSGLSTFSGITTHTAPLFGTQASFSGIVTASSFSGNASSATYSTTAGVSTYATTAGIATNVIGGIGSVTQLSVSGVSTLGITSTTNLTTQQLSVSGLSTFSGITTYTTSVFGTQASFSGIVTASSFSGNASSATYSTTAGIATYATTSGVSTNIKGGLSGNIPYQSSADTTTFVSNGTSGQVLIFNGSVPTWGNVSAASGSFGGITIRDEGNVVGTANSITTINFVGNNVTATATSGANGISTVTIADYVSVAGIATYATTAGIATNVIGGIGSVTQLSVSGVSTLGITSTTNLTTQQLSVSGVSTFASNTTINSSGIVATGIITARNAATQDSISLNGRAGGTGSFNLSLVPTTLGASRTATFQDVSGTVYVTGGTDVSLADGGTNASLTASNGGIVYSTASAMAILSGTATAGQILQSGASAAPSWSTATFPSTATSAGTILRADGTNWVATSATYPTTTTANRILYSSATNTVGEITSANTSALITNSTGVPSFTSGTTANRLLRTDGTTVSFAQANLTTDVTGTLPIANGGTNSTATATNGGVAYGTGSAYAFTLAGTSGQVLTSNGAGAPTWQTAAGGVTISDDTTTNATRYIGFSTVTSGGVSALNVASTKLQFNPSTGTLSATAFTSLSDKTMKKNIRPILTPIELTRQLRGVRYDWIDTNQSSIGVIAQEIEQVLPEVVTTNSDGTKSVSYGNIIGVLIEAIKEQQIRIEELERKLNA